MKVSLRKISTKNGQKIVLRSPLASEAEHILNHLRITHAESYKNLNQSFDYWNEFSNSGLGTQMLQYTLELSKEIGFHRVELTVRTYNQPGIKLYEKLGFQKIGLLSDAAFIDGAFVDEYSFQIILNGK